MSDAQVSQMETATTQGAEDEIDLLALLGALLDQKWTIIFSTVCVTALAVAYAILGTPVYQAGALLQVEEKAASLPGLEDLSRGVWLGVLHASGTRNFKIAICGRHRCNQP